MSLEIINNPLFVTIQDMGRYGYSHIGVTNSGVMDEYAYLFAQKLLKNPPPRTRSAGPGRPVPPTASAPSGPGRTP